MRSVDDQAEDFVWGRVAADRYLRDVACSRRVDPAVLLERAHGLQASLDAQLRKGVEQQLPRLMQQAGALDELERTQSAVNQQMHELFSSTERLAKELGRLTTEQKAAVVQQRRLLATQHALVDAIRCDELLEQWEKKKEVMRRAELVAELRAIAADAPLLARTDKMRGVVVDGLRRAERETRQDAAAQLRRGLQSLNEPFVTGALRALRLLDAGALQEERDVLVAEAVSACDRALQTLGTSGAATDASAVCRVLREQLEQVALLGREAQTQFIPKLGRLILARVASDSPQAARFLQLASKMGGAAAAAAAELSDQLRPLRTALVARARHRLLQTVQGQDLSEPANVNVFADQLLGAIADERRALDFDGALAEELERAAVRPALEEAARVLEAQLKMAPEQLLLAERTTATQAQNYRVLAAAARLVRGAGGAAELRTVLHDGVERVWTVVRGAVAEICQAQQTEAMGGASSPAGRELLAYLDAVRRHADQMADATREVAPLSTLTAWILRRWTVHAAVLAMRVRRRRAVASSEDCSSRISEWLRREAQAVKGALAKMDASFPQPLLDAALDAVGAPNLAELSPTRSGRPAWLLTLLLVADSPPEFPTPFEDNDDLEAVKRFVNSFTELDDAGRMTALGTWLANYQSLAVSRGDTVYVPHFPKLQRLLE